VTAEADRALLDGAVAMAWTAIDAALDERVRGRLLAPGPGPGTAAGARTG